LFWVKNAIFFAEFFGENSFKIITGWPGSQGDQNRRIFDHWVTIYSGRYFQNFRSSPLFSMVQVMYRIWQKMGWATFWAIFSQAHPVTLCT
jgi:hypothetical protein